MPATFELFRDRADEFRWRLRHDNGQIIAAPGQGYTSKANAVNGIESVKTNAPEAAVEDHTGDDGPETIVEGSTRATFEVYSDSAGQFRWRLQHDNGDIIAEPGEGYTSKQNAIGGLESVKANAVAAEVEDQTVPATDEAPAAASSSAETVVPEATPAAPAPPTPTTAPAASTPAAPAPTPASAAGGGGSSSPISRDLWFWLNGITTIFGVMFVLAIGIEVAARLSDSNSEELWIYIATVLLSGALVVKALLWGVELLSGEMFKRPSDR